MGEKHEVGDPYKVPKYCMRCKRPMEGVHPFAIGVVDLHTPTGPGMSWETGRIIFCALCLIDVSEAIVPNIKQLPRWISEKDQTVAEIKAHMRENGIE
jgi:hypothetical protein